MDLPMSVLALDPLDLAAMLCSRVCHDVISPVGAIVNGLEVLEDEEDESMREVALDLIKRSAAGATIPRGGAIEVEATGEGAAARLRVAAKGANARLQAGFADLMCGRAGA